ncbi:MAG: Clp protease N-terminal domain-containing protein [Caldilineaceae bacterium]
MTDNLERFTKRARGALKLSEEEAIRLHHNYIGTEHLLLGLIGEEEGLAAKVLRDLNVDFSLVRNRVEQTVGLGERASFGKPTLAPRAKKVIELAVQMAAQFGHRYIGTEHLILGLLEEGEGVGIRILQEFVSVAAIVTGLTTRLSSSTPISAEQLIKRQTLEENLQNLQIELQATKQMASQGRLPLDWESALKLHTAVREERARQIYAAAVQEERGRLARDLHDSIKQQLFSINVSAAAVRERWTNDPNGASAALDDIQQSAQAALVEMNAMLQQLSPTPLAVAGLIEALHEQCQALAFRTGAEVTTAFGELPPVEALPLGAQETLFRIAQEALSNIARHARANRVHLRLERATEANAVVLEIRDDGQGFEPAKMTSGMGLANIQERATRLNGQAIVQSAPEQGTTIYIKLPLLEQNNE